MKRIISIGTIVLILGASIFLISRPTYADTGTTISTAESVLGTHTVWTSAGYGLFKLQRFGIYCMPGEQLTNVPIGAKVLGMETRECEGIPQRFRRVTYKDYSGWMWDFTLMENDPLEGHFPDDTEEEIPIIKEDEVVEVDEAVEEALEPESKEQVEE